MEMLRSHGPDFCLVCWLAGDDEVLVESERAHPVVVEKERGRSRAQLGAGVALLGEVEVAGHERPVRGIPLTFDLDPFVERHDAGTGPVAESCHVGLVLPLDAEPALVPHRFEVPDVVEDHDARVPVLFEPPDESVLARSLVRVDVEHDERAVEQLRFPCLARFGRPEIHEVPVHVGRQLPTADVVRDVEGFHPSAPDRERERGVAEMRADVEDGPFLYASREMSQELVVLLVPEEPFAGRERPKRLEVDPFDV